MTVGLVLIGNEDGGLSWSRFSFEEHLRNVLGISNRVRGADENCRDDGNGFRVSDGTVDDEAPFGTLEKYCFRWQIDGATQKPGFHSLFFFRLLSRALPAPFGARQYP